MFPAVSLNNKCSIISGPAHYLRLMKGNILTAQSITMNHYKRLLGIILTFFLFSCHTEIDIEDLSSKTMDCGRIVIVPDIQFYTNNINRQKYLDAIISYCIDNKDSISFLLQTGDVTNNNQPWHFLL